MKGKVYMNFMIDLRVTNTKLYRRAVNILQVPDIMNIIKKQRSLTTFLIIKKV